MFFEIFSLFLVFIVLVGFLYNIKLYKRQHQNRITLKTGETICIPTVSVPLLDLLRGLKSITKSRGKNALSSVIQKIFQLKEGKELKMQQSFILFYPSITIWNPEIARLVLFSKDENITKLTLGNSATDRLLGDSILLAEGDDWTRHKTTLSPAFSWTHIQSVLGEFNSIVSEMKDIWNEEKKQEGFEIYPWLKKATLDAIGKGGFGSYFKALQVGNESENLQNYQDLMKELQNPVHLISWVAKLFGSKKRLDDKFQNFEDFMQLLISTKREKIQNSREEYELKDVLDYLVAAEENQHLSDREIAHDMNTFFIAGHETVAGALCSLIHLLAVHPEIQSKLREEIFSNCSENEPTYEEIKQMNYLECCINETLRLFPPALAVTRTAKEDVQLGNLSIHKGTIFVIMTAAIHRDEDLWGSNASEFVPDRFSGKNRKQIPRMGFMPFSMGPRQCIGNRFALLEIKSFICVLLKNFTFSPDPNCPEEFCDYVGTVLEVNPKRKLIVTPLG